MTVDGGTVHRVIGTLEVAVLVIGTGRAIERVKVQATNETHILSHQLSAVDIAHVGLGDGLVALLLRERGVQGIVEVYIAVIAHREVLDGKRVAPEVEHREVADSPLCLSALRSQYNVLRILVKSDEMEDFCTDNGTKGFPAILADGHLRRVGIIDPIDTGSDVERGSVGDMGSRLLEVPKGIGTGLL